MEPELYFFNPSKIFSLKYLNLHTGIWIKDIRIEVLDIWIQVWDPAFGTEFRIQVSDIPNYVSDIRIQVSNPGSDPDPEFRFWYQDQYSGIGYPDTSFSYPDPSFEFRFRILVLGIRIQVSSRFSNYRFPKRFRSGYPILFRYSDPDLLRTQS